MAGIYLHVPFCKQACYYCDFHFSTNQSLRAVLVDAMVREISWQRAYLSEPVETIYFGGGTPSLLPAADVARLLAAIRDSFEVVALPEVTLEANPDDLTPDKLQELFSAGINRLSIGIQSFRDDVLTFLNRAHDATAALKCLEDARMAGFANISIDLIYAIPGQPQDQWSDNVDTALSYAPEHISAYSLTIEERTVFGRWSARGSLRGVDDDAAAAQLEFLVNRLERSGYEHYEVSNFCRPGFRSRHNSSYWTQRPYLGIGPSAHSYNVVSRQYNVSNNHEYVRAIGAGRIPFTREELSAADMANDYLLTTLRTSWGSDLEKLRSQYGYDVLGRNRAYIDRLIAENLAGLEGRTLVLTAKGRLLADKISSDLFLQA